MKRALIIIAIVVASISGGYLFVSSNNNSSTEEPATIDEEVIPNYRISASEAKSILDSDAPFVLVDVRTTEEYASEHIVGAISISHDKIPEEAPSQIPDKTAPVLVYCQSGNRSAFAAGALVALGYTNVLDLGGIEAWPYDNKISGDMPL